MSGRKLSFSPPASAGRQTQSRHRRDRLPWSEQKILVFVRTVNMINLIKIKGGAKSERDAVLGTPVGPFWRCLI